MLIPRCSSALLVAALLPAAASGQKAARLFEVECTMPVNPNPIEVRQPDGDVLVLHVRGNAYDVWYVDDAGRPVLRAQDGSYVYAELDADGALRPTTWAVGDEVAPLVQFPLNVDPVDAPGADPKESHVELSQLGYRKTSIQPVKALGTVKNLVLLLRFADHGPKGQDRDVPADADVDTIMNKLGGDPVLAPSGSVRDHYLEDSYGQFTIESIVVGWLDVPETEVYYANGNSGLTTVTWELIIDGLEAADPFVDFADFDADGDGVIDAITFLHSGYGAEWIADDEYGTTYVDRIWSHKWGIPTWTSAEGVTVSEYNISPGLWGVSGSEPGRIGVVVHELGHFFGLPDLYDTNGNGQGIGNWDLMAAGSWSFDGSQLYPTHMTSWSKAVLGWLTPERILPGTYELESLSTTPHAYRIDSGYPAGEYLLVENRDPSGFDVVVPQSGLAVYHVDEAKGAIGNNNTNNDEGYPGQEGWPENNSHYRIGMLQADGLYEMELNFNRGDAGDVLHGGGVTHLDGASVPDLRAYQEGQIVDNGNAITNVGTPGSTIEFTYDNASGPSINEGTFPKARLGMPYSQQMAAQGGVGPFRWTEYRDMAYYESKTEGANLYAAVGDPQGWHADEEKWALDLPFSFPFYEETYDRIWVSSNGFIDFWNGDGDAFGKAAFLQATVRIAPFWADLRTDQAGEDIYVDTSLNDRVTVRWVGSSYNTGLPCEFAVTLFRNGVIQFHYGPGNLGESPTIGISRGHSADLTLAGGLHGSDDLDSADSYRFVLAGSQIPPGMRLTQDGRLAGTPKEPGIYRLNVRVTGSDHVYDQRRFKVEVVSPRETRRAKDASKIEVAPRALTQR